MLEVGRSRIRLLASAIASAITLSVFSNTVVLPSGGLEGPGSGAFHVSYRLRQLSDSWGLRMEGAPLHYGNGTEGSSGHSILASILDEPPEQHAAGPGTDDSRRLLRHDVRDALTDPARVKPLRSAEEMARAQACARRFDGYVHLLHMRKAGGSTLRYHLSEMVRRERQRLVYVTEGDTFNASCFRHQGEMVFVTSMRHPISRLVSSYWYEGRFTETPRGKPINRTSTRSFEEWLRAAREEEAGQRGEFSARRVWHCVDNYYTKTLTNRYRRDVQSPVTRQDFELAKRLLLSMDAVLITEWMGLSNQTAYLNALLGLSPVTLPLNSLNRQAHNRSRSEVLSPSSLSQLEAANGWDMLLYEFAQRLTSSRIQAYEEQEAEAVDKGTGGNKEEGKEKEEGKREEEEKEEEEEEELLTCRAPEADPRWRRRGGRTDKPFPDSYLYSRPKCMDNDFNEKLLRELW